jgi:hypothetical protein
MERKVYWTATKWDLDDFVVRVLYNDNDDDNHTCFNM